MDKNNIDNIDNIDNINSANNIVNTKYLQVVNNYYRKILNEIKENNEGNCLFCKHYSKFHCAGACENCKYDTLNHLKSQTEINLLTNCFEFKYIII